MLDPFVERLIIFEHLPIADTLFAHQPLARFPRLAFLTRTPRAQLGGRKKNAGVRIPSLKRAPEPLGQGLIRGVVTQEPPPHESTDAVALLV